MSRVEGMLSLDQLQADADRGEIDTVVAAFTDMQGRLMGKRINASFFLEDVTEHGIEGCDYLLALDMEMDPVPGYELANWEKGYGDFAITPDLQTLRRIPWLDRTALVLCDVRNHDGSPFVASPRQILIAQYERAQRMGYTPMFASELEFYLYKQSYAEAHERDYSGLTPTIPYILDYHILATTMDEAIIGQLRRGMQGAAIPVEFSKGEAWAGQHELNVRYADAVTSADRHTIYKNGVKEIAFLNGVSATFMAKPSEKDIGSSCHIHSKPRRPERPKRLRGRPRGDGRFPPLARWPACADQRARTVHLPLGQLVQALRDRELGAHLDRLGPRQPYRRISNRRAW